MTDDTPQTVIVHAAPPGSVIGAFGATLDVLKTSPVLLLIVLLNGFFCAAAGYYLLQVEAYRHIERRDVIEMLGRCMKAAAPEAHASFRRAPGLTMRTTTGALGESYG